MTNKVYVGNLNYSVTQDDLQQFFGDLGEIKSVTIPMDRETGKPRGFAFVEFSDAGTAQKATEMSGQELMGRTLKINIAKEREERSGGGGSRGGRSGGGNRGGRSFDQNDRW